MKNHQPPIGIFDSGLGGLTVLQPIQALLPDESLVYVADSAFAPYGNKDNAVVVQRAEYIAKYLVDKHHIKALVVACNTATAAAIQNLRAQLEIPVIGMEPALKPAVNRTKTGVVGILATENTLKSDKFSHLFDTHQHLARIITQPCFGLVEAIEQGKLEHESTQDLLLKYVQPLLDAGADTIVLGCTHYPLLEPILRQIVGEHLYIISTGEAVAQRLKAQLAYVSTSDATPPLFFTSGDAELVSKVASHLIKREISFQHLC